MTAVSRDREETDTDRVLSSVVGMLSVLLVWINTYVWWDWFSGNLSYVPYGHPALLKLTVACIGFPPLVGAATYVLRYLRGVDSRADRLVDALLAALFASIPPLLVAIPLHI